MNADFAIGMTIGLISAALIASGIHIAAIGHIYESANKAGVGHYTCHPGTGHTQWSWIPHQTATHPAVPAVFQFNGTNWVSGLYKLPHVIPQ